MKTLLVGVTVALISVAACAEGLPAVPVTVSCPVTLQSVGFEIA